MKVNKTLTAFGFVMSALLVAAVIVAFVVFSIKFLSPVGSMVLIFTVVIAILTWGIRSALDD